MLTLRLILNSLLQLIFLGQCFLLQSGFVGVGNIQDSSASRGALVTGFVQDETGEPLPGATVTAQPEGPIGLVLPQTRTDSKGRFSLGGLHPGKTFVSANKEEEFYPDTSWRLWNLGPGSVQLNLPAGGIISDIKLQVSPAAMLKITAVNAETSAAINDFGFHIERADTPSRYIGGSRPRWLVPTSPILVRVEAKGFKPAWYSRMPSSRNPTPLSLAPRQFLVITVALRPVPE